MSPPVPSRRVLCSLATLALAAAACGGADPSATADAVPAADGDVASEATADAVDADPSLDADATPTDGPPQGPLFATELHDGTSPGTAGTGRLEVDGTVVELTAATCTHETFGGGELIFAEARGDSDVGPLEVRVSRRLAELDGGTDEHDVTVARLSDDPGTWAEWTASAVWSHVGDETGFRQGDGEVPLVRAVEGSAVSARGELAFPAMADGELSGPFEVVVTCP